jgi:AraC-like DNA-binding protein
MSGKLGLFFNEEVQRLIDSFAYCFKVKITVFSAEMEELLVGLQNPGAQFCRLIQNNLHFRYRCCRQDKLMCERCRQKRKILAYHCYAGLREAVIPLKIDDTLIGYAMLGQFRTCEELPGEIIRDWCDKGYDPKILKNAFLEQPFFDPSALDNMLRLFSMLVGFIVTREYVKVRRPDLVEKTLQWLEDHLAERATLNDIAAAMNRSVSTISHRIKQQLGLSFKQLCILKRIQRFESIISGEQHISIREAAAKVGYNDPYYFSRIYKKVRLTVPSQYVKSYNKQKRDNVRINA